MNLALDALAVEVSGQLAAGGVRALVLKGPSLTGWLYGEGSTRFSRDVDLLVDPEAFEQAERLLEGRGLQPQVPWREDRTARHWRREDSAFEIDLHRTLVGVGVSPQDAWETLSGRTEPLDVAGGSVEVLDPAARALVLALHAAKHQSVRGQPLDDLERG
ncbi:MAG TPA: nucleotidyltransferase family protein, partial [Gaiellaceae bacterium]|nr:nucleotidyltransferase family protein [Gaiellaceae bacterium]